MFLIVMRVDKMKALRIITNWIVTVCMLVALVGITLAIICGVYRLDQIIGWGWQAVGLVVYLVYRPRWPPARYGRCSRHASFLGWQMNKKLKEKEWTVYFEPSSSHYCDIAYANKDWNRSIRFKCAEHYHQFTELLKEAGYVYIDLSFLIIDGLIKPSSIFSV